MTIPTVGNITSAAIQDEWHYAAPWTSAQVAASASLAAPWTSADLRGKSAAPQVSVAPTSVSGENDGDGIHPILVDSGHVTATVAGGLAPYTLAWELVSGDALTLLGADPLDASWRKAFPAAGGSSSSIYRLKATDANSQVGYSPGVNIELTANGD